VLPVQLCGLSYRFETLCSNWACPFGMLEDSRGKLFSPKTLNPSGT
jgi:hypothetical protein